MRAMCADFMCSQKWMFHATPEENLKSILVGGLTSNFIAGTNGSTWGTGIYFGRFVFVHVYFFCFAFWEMWM
jgi:hypothetical protein